MGTSAIAASANSASLAASEFLQASLALDSVVVADPVRLQAKLAAVFAGGLGRLHIVSDFDMTLTAHLCPRTGERNTTSHAVVATSRLTPAVMRERTDALYRHYFPIEISHELTPQQKFPHMEEWWHNVHKAIAESGLTRGAIQQMVAEASPITWRPGVPEAVALCEQHGVPVLVFSAGLADVILELLGQANLLTPNMHVISNKMIFDAAPPHAVVGFEPPIIHVFNKNEGALAAANLPYFEEVAHRDNVLLLGDSLGDLRMVEGMSHAQCVAVGFCNHDADKLVPVYSAAYDIVITDDGDMGVINHLLREMAALGTT